MDTTIRRRQREAATGDPAAEAAWLAERLRAAPVCERCDASTYGAGTLRVATTTAALVMCPACAGTGSPFRARLELAAYCGSGPAHAVIGLRDVMPLLFGRVEFAAWLSGLSRWADVGDVPGWVLMCAGVAAARVALDAEPNGCGPGDATWHDGPECCPVHAAQRRAIEAAEAWLACPCGEAGECERRFLAASAAVHHDAAPHAHQYAWLPAGPWSYDPQHAHNREAPIHAARLAGEAPVRSAICSALVAWALA